MKSPARFPARVRLTFVSAAFVTMTIIFLAVPYALSRHPGEPSPHPVNTESRTPGR